MPGTFAGVIFRKAAGQGSTLAAQLAEGFSQHQAAHTYSVALTAKGDLQWQTQENGQTVTFDSEPKSHRVQRFVVWLCEQLPIEWLL